VAIETAAVDEEAELPDLRSHALDTLVKSRRRLTDQTRTAIHDRVTTRLAMLEDLAITRDPRLATPAQALLVYLLAADLLGADAAERARFMDFLAWFTTARAAALDRPEGERDPELIEYSELTQHGATERRNIERRLAILREQRARWEVATPA
jgi:hypothetical protein